MNTQPQTATIIDAEVENKPTGEDQAQAMTLHEEYTPPAVIAANSASSIMGIIGQLSTNPNVDVDKIEKLMAIFVRETERAEALEEKRKADEARRLFNVAFVKMKPELPLVIRSKKNDHTKSMYAPLEDVNKTIDPTLFKFGFGTTASIVKQTEADVTMELSIIHDCGHVMTMQLTMPIDDKGPGGTKNKTTGQGIASTMTTLKRVGFCAMLNISTGDDKDGNSPSNAVQTLITPEQAIQLDADIKVYFLDREDFLTWLAGSDEPITDTRNVTEAQFKRAMGAVRDAKREMEKERAEKAKRAGGVK